MRQGRTIKKNIVNIQYVVSVYIYTQLHINEYKKIKFQLIQ